MSDFVGDWPSILAPWDKAIYLQAQAAVTDTGPTGAYKQVLSDDPNRVAIWFNLAPAAPTSIVTLNAQYPGTLHKIPVAQWSVVDPSGPNGYFYYWWERHGPLVQGSWFWNGPNVDFISVTPLVLTKWPARELPQPIKVPKCPTISSVVVGSSLKS